MDKGLQFAGLRRLSCSAWPSWYWESRRSQRTIFRERLFHVGPRLGLPKLRMFEIISKTWSDYRFVPLWCTWRLVDRIAQSLRTRDAILAVRVWYTQPAGTTAWAIVYGAKKLMSDHGDHSARTSPCASPNAASCSHVLRIFKPWARWIGRVWWSSPGLCKHSLLCQVCKLSRQ